MTFLEEKIIPTVGVRTKRSCIFRCDICGKEWETSHCIKENFKKEHHFCSKECGNIAQRNGGLINEKKKQIFQEKYGVPHPWMLKEIQNKKKTTNLERYGFEYSLQNKEVQEKSKATILERYGCENPQQSQEIQEKTKATNLERYGHENCAHSKEAKAKIEVTLQDNYGVKHPAQSKIVQDKMKATNLERFGVENAMQNTEVFSKAQKAKRKAIILFHWKTDEELTCIGSYEVAVVNWLNSNKTDFEWQIRFETPLLTPTGRKSFYTIDLHILDGKFADTWVEIKGWLNGSCKEKWEWFHSQYPNSELWNLPRLKELGIL